jgi:membrane protease YdiL (CAAX protease family)
MPIRRRSWTLAVLLACALLALTPIVVRAAVDTHASANAPQMASTEQTGSSLEAAAAKASSTGRTIAMSLIGLALAVAAIVLAFRRDFKEAAGVFAVGIVAVLLATPAGVSLLQDTVSSLFGSHS